VGRTRRHAPPSSPSISPSENDQHPAGLPARTLASNRVVSGCVKPGPQDGKRRASMMIRTSGCPAKVDQPLDDAVRLADQRAKHARKLVSRVTWWSVVVLLVLSFVAAVLPAFPGLNSSVRGAIAIVVVFLTALPTALDVVERLHSNAAGRRYRAWVKACEERLEARIRRRLLSRLFAWHGRQEIARRVLPADEAAWYSIARVARRRRMPRLVIACVLLTGLCPSPTSGVVGGRVGWVWAVWVGGAPAGGI
jgi:hypothetical protein